jgi:hypothetical protein
LAGRGNLSINCYGKGRIKAAAYRVRGAPQFTPQTASVMNRHFGGRFLWRRSGRVHRYRVRFPIILFGIDTLDFFRISGRVALSGEIGIDLGWLVRMMLE